MSDYVDKRAPWAPPKFTIGQKHSAHVVLQDSSLLESFFARLQDMCTLIAAAPGTSSADLSLAWQMVELKKVNVLVYGQTGAGKSTLIGELVGKDGLGGATTFEVDQHTTASGVCFVDRPGIDIPGAVSTDAESTATQSSMSVWHKFMHTLKHWADEQAKRASWKKTLDDLDRRLRSNSAEDRPLALVYVHKAGNPRLYKEHIKALLTKAHTLLVPTFVVMADKWSADEPSRQILERDIKEMIDELGENKRHKRVQYHLLSARQYKSGTTTHPSMGMGEFVAGLLSNLEPADAITFIRQAGFSAGNRKRPAASLSTAYPSTDAPSRSEVATDVTPPMPSFPARRSGTDCNTSAKKRRKA